MAGKADFTGRMEAPSRVTGAGMLMSTALSETSPTALARRVPS